MDKQPVSIDLDKTLEICKNFFTWSILAILSIFISGKFMDLVVVLPETTKKIFKVRLLILTLELTENQVILGLTSFLITLMFTALSTNDATISSLATGKFGLDLPHFQALCFISSIFTLTWVLICFCAFRCIIIPCLRLVRHNTTAHEKAIEKIMKKVKKNEEWQ